MHVAAAMFTPASLIAAATRASAPGVFSMSMTRSTAMRPPHHRTPRCAQAPPGRPLGPAPDAVAAHRVLAGHCNRADPFPRGVVGLAQGVVVLLAGGVGADDG